MTTSKISFVQQQPQQQLGSSQVTHGSSAGTDRLEKLPHSIQPQAMHTNERTNEMTGPTGRRCSGYDCQSG